MSPNFNTQSNYLLLNKSGNPIGPTADQLQQSGKTWEEIIKSATKPGGKDLGF